MVFLPARLLALDARTGNADTLRTALRQHIEVAVLTDRLVQFVLDEEDPELITRIFITAPVPLIKATAQP